MAPPVTVAAYFEQHAFNGRAVLGRTSIDLRWYEPPTWISKATYRGRVSYWLCKRDECEIEQLDADQDVTTIKARATRKTRAWHHAMARKSDAFLNSLTPHAIM